MTEAAGALLEWLETARANGLLSGKFRGQSASGRVAAGNWDT